MDDLISRQALCEYALNQKDKSVTPNDIMRFPSTEPEEFEWCTDCKEYDQNKHCCHRWNKVIRETVEELKQAQSDWIPVTERLPEDEQPVLFSIKTGRVHQGKYYNDGSMNQWYSALDKMRAFNNVVNAWMPLPEPYAVMRGGEDDLLEG